MVDPGYRGGLPWTPEKGENGRFALILLAAFILFLPPAILIPLTEVAEPERSEREEVPPRLARLIEQRQPPEPQPEAVPEPVPEPEPEKEPEPAQVEDQPPSPQPATAVAEKEPVVEPPAEASRQAVERAREKASRSGLLAMKDRLATMRSPESESRPTLTANVSSERPAATGEAHATDSLQGSGGVSTAKGPTKDVDVQAHQVREVAVAADPVRAVEPEKPGPPERGMTNIRKVFDAQKTALYSIYRRELRQDPTLEGKVLLELVIEPDGSVSSCEVVNSELDNPELESRIATRVRLFNFGAADVAARKVKFPIDFLPG